MGKHHWIKNWMAGEWGGWTCMLCSQMSLNLPDTRPNVKGCPGSKLSDQDIDLLDVLRRHPRSVSTISWAVSGIAGEPIPEPDVLLMLESLERRGLACTVPESMLSSDSGGWWIITPTGQSFQRPALAFCDTSH
jgi:hypothetical protein